MMSIALFTQVWASCVGPAVAVETGAAVARAESGLDTLAIHDNTADRSYTPARKAEAMAVARTLHAAGHSLDLGLMQINTANLSRLSLTIAGAFDPCRNMAAGAQILVDAYRARQAGRAVQGRDVQVRLGQALSRYNTGDSAAGFVNGYVARVRAAAGQIVPAIALLHDTTGSTPADDQHADDTSPRRINRAQLIDGLIHPNAGAADVTNDRSRSDDALIHPSDPPPPRGSPSAPPPSQASPRPSH